MKRLICSLSFTMIGIVGRTQSINIPDSHLRNALLSSASAGYAFNQSGQAITIDNNNNGSIEVNEALTVYRLELMDLNIVNIQGLEFFHNLSYLGLQLNYISVFSSAGMPNLKSLILCWNPLNSLYVSNSPGLTVLDVSYTNLTTLNTDQLSNIEVLDCSGSNISSLNLNNLLELKVLEVSSTNLSTLDLSHQLELLTLGCSYLPFDSLDLSGCPNLWSLVMYGSGNVLKSLNVKNVDVQNLHQLILNAPELQFICCNFSDSSYIADNWVGNNLIGVAGITEISSNCGFLNVEEFDTINTLTISPNPSNDFLTVGTRYLGTVELIDIFGNVVLTWEQNENVQLIDLRDVGSGIYFVKNYFNTKKLVIN